MAEATQSKQSKERSKINDTLTAVSQQKGKMPPQALELEEAVIGALMLEKHAILNVQEVLRADAFYKEAHQLIFQAVLDLSARIEPIDMLTVSNQLQKMGQLQAIGGLAYLASLTQKVGSAAHIEFHAKIVAQKYIQRQLIASATEIQEQSFSEDKDVSDLLDFAESEIFKIAEGNIKRDVQKSRDILSKALKAIEEAGQKPDGMSGVPSGFTEVDRLTMGWQPSDLVIIAARPSMGKTAFVLSLARNIAVDFQNGVAFFSLEMSSVQLMMRLIIGESGLDSNLIKSGKLTPDQWKHLEASVKPLSGAKLFIDDTPALSIFEFRSKARRLKSQFDIQIIIIDYLQLMTAGTSDGKGNREQEVATISRSLKAIAKELNVPILALSQLNRSVESRGGTKRPQLSDLRESGAIEQDADIVAFIHRPEYYGLTLEEDGTSTAGLAQIIFAKHRNGAVGDVKLRFRAEQAKFMDWDDTGISGITTGGGIEVASSGWDDGGFDDLSASQGSVVMATPLGGGSFDEAPF